jgi:hypothetical protein
LRSSYKRVVQLEFRFAPSDASLGSLRQGTCWQPEVKGLTLMENSIFNSWRMEDVWLDK